MDALPLVARCTRWNVAAVARRVVLALVVVVSAAGCGTGSIDVDGGYSWRERHVEERRIASFRRTNVLPAPAGGGRPEVLVQDGDGWLVQAVGDGPGVVTDVVKWGIQAIAVGAVGADRLPADDASDTPLRSAVWIGNESARWRRLELPAPAGEPGWFVGIEWLDGLVVVGRAAGADGAVFALRPDDALMTSWTATTIAAGRGLQYPAAAVATRARTIVVGGAATWISDARGPWRESQAHSLGHPGFGAVAVRTVEDDVFVASGPARRGALGDVLLARLGPSSAQPLAVLPDQIVLTGVAWGRSLVFVTDVASVALRGRHLRLVAVGPDGTVTSARLPLRAEDVAHMTSWQAGLGVLRAAIAWRRPDGSLHVATLRDR